MRKIVVCVSVTLMIMYAVAFLVYGVVSAMTGLKPPEGAPPIVFLLSILVVKTGHAVTFVLLFHLARSSLTGRWLWYAVLWWLMFVLGEVGEAIGPRYSWQEAVPGVVAETIYFPLSAFVVNRLLGVKSMDNG